MRHTRSEECGACLIKSERKFKLLTEVLSFLFFLHLFCCSTFANSDNKYLPEVKILKVSDLGAIEISPVINGRDGGYSALYKGRSIWVFGDTILKKNDQNGLNFHSSSWSVTSDLYAGDGIKKFIEMNDSSGIPYELFPFTEEEKEYNESHSSDNCEIKPCGSRWAIWPGPVIEDQERNRLLVFYEKILVNSGHLNFKSQGHSLALWNDFAKPSTRINYNLPKKDRTILFDEKEPGFGSAAIVFDSMLYAFGCDSSGSSKPCRLARVVIKNAFSRKSWEYYSDQDKWQNKIGKCKVIFAGNNIMSVSYNLYLKKLIAIYSRPMSSDVMLRIAQKIEGPWSEPVLVFKAKRPESDLGWVYDALEHPEYAVDNGKTIYITYSRQTGLQNFEMRLVSVQLAKN